MPLKDGSPIRESGTVAKQLTRFLGKNSVEIGKPIYTALNLAPERNLTARKILGDIAGALDTISTHKGNQPPQLPINEKELLQAVQLLNGVGLAYHFRHASHLDIQVTPADRQAAEALAKQYQQLQGNLERCSAIGTAIPLDDCFGKMFFHTQGPQKGFIGQILDKQETVHLPPASISAHKNETIKSFLATTKDLEDILDASIHDETIPLCMRNVVGASFAQITQHYIDALQLHKQTQDSRRSKKDSPSIRNARSLFVFNTELQYVNSKRHKDKRTQEYLDAIEAWRTTLLLGLIGGRSLVPDFSFEQVKQLFQEANQSLIDNDDSDSHTLRLSLSHFLIEKITKDFPLRAYQLVHDSLREFPAETQHMFKSRKPDNISFATAMELTLLRRKIHDGVIATMYQEGTYDSLTRHQLEAIDTTIGDIIGTYSRSTALRDEHRIRQLFADTESQERMGELLEDRIATLQATLSYNRPLNVDSANSTLHPVIIPSGTLNYPRIYEYQFKPHDEATKIFGEGASIEFFGANDPNKPMENVLHFTLLTHNGANAI